MPKQIVADERTQRIAGLREMADFLEAHPSIPIQSVEMQVFVFGRAAFALIARLTSWEKVPLGNYFGLRKTFSGDAQFQVFTDRDEVCRKVVTGTRIQPAQPEQVVEEFHWECDEPLLAQAHEARPV